MGKTSGSALGASPSGARLERIRSSPRYVGGRFVNTDPVRGTLKKGTALSTMREYLFGGQRRTPPGPLPALDPRATWKEPPRTGLRATWLGHSTVLLELDGFRVLTDPVWGPRASPSISVGPKRFQPVPVALSELPPIDVVLVSHDHYDHLDAPTIRELAKTQVPFVTALGVGAHLEAWGVAPERITELDWWEQYEVPGTAKGSGLSVHATPARHFSGRAPMWNNQTLWASWVVATPQHRVFFSGDTGLTDEFTEIRDRKGPFDLVMLEVGAWHPNWGDIHLGPENALVAHGMLGGGPLLPIHWGTFNLAIHAWDEPLETLARLSPERGVTLLTPRLGGWVEPARPQAIDRWWREVGTREPASEDAVIAGPAT